jgi:predicted ester cyclase
VGYNQRFATALPDIHFEVLHVLAEGDHVLIHWQGAVSTPNGWLP